MATQNDFIRQTFEVSYEYAVAFTNHLFEPKNQTLRTILLQAGEKASVLVCIDSGVYAH